MEDRRVAPPVARFLRGQAVVGGGVLVGGGRVLTCAHVVNAALGLKGGDADRPASAVTLDFPLQGTPAMAALVVEWSPLVAIGNGDVALVEVDEQLVADLAAPGLTPRPVAADEELALFGFPRSHPAGVWKRELRRAGPLVGAWQQLLAGGGRDYKLQGGFSGCPVIDADGCVVGIFAQAEEAADVDAGAEIPIEVAAREVGLPLAAPPLPRAATATRAWNVPPLRNPNFTGREAELAELAATLASDHVVALTGLGGIGKSQVAVQFAYRHADEYDVVWWLAAEQDSTLVAGLAQLAETLGLPEAGGGDRPSAARAARRWLEQHERWLLVFDNAPDADGVDEWLPQARTGHALITSRHAAWGAVARRIVLGALDVEAGARLLLRRTGESDDGAARELSEKLGGLPLALEQASGYVEATGTPLAEYVALFDARHETLLSYSGPTGANTVATTWDLGFDQISKSSPNAAALLRLAAFLAPEDIPRDLFVGNEQLPERGAALADPIALGDAVAALTRYSLVTALGGAIGVHRLVQTVTRDRLADDDRRAWAEAAVTTLATRLRFSENDPGTWPSTGRLVPHALQACAHAVASGAGSLEATELLNNCGLYLRTHAQMAAAEAAHRGALDLARQAPGGGNILSACLVNLGLVLRERADFAGARTAYEEAIVVDEAQFGPDHHEVAVDLSNLGNLLLDIGDYKGARKAFERALAIDEAALGNRSPDVAIRLNNLGGVLHTLGELDAAGRALQQALEIDRATYGARHLQVAADLANLGQLRYRQGDLAAASEALAEALEIDEETYGPDHPRVGVVVASIGTVLAAQGDSEGARRAFERALAIVERVFGADHPRAAAVLSELGILLFNDGDHAGAKEAIERVVAIRERSFGAESPLTAVSLENLAVVLSALGDTAGAEAARARAAAATDQPPPP